MQHTNDRTPPVNVAVQLGEDGKLYIVVDPDARHGRTAAGLSDICARTNGRIRLGEFLPGTAADGLELDMSVYAPLPQEVRTQIRKEKRIEWAETQAMEIAARKLGFASATAMVEAHKGMAMGASASPAPTPPPRTIAITPATPALAPRRGRGRGTSSVLPPSGTV